jgi:hypothetical protein
MPRRRKGRWADESIAIESSLSQKLTVDEERGP